MSNDQIENVFHGIDTLEFNLECVGKGDYESELQFVRDHYKLFMVNAFMFLLKDQGLLDIGYMVLEKHIGADMFKKNKEIFEELQLKINKLSEMDQFKSLPRNKLILYLYCEYYCCIEGTTLDKTKGVTEVFNKCLDILDIMIQKIKEDTEDNNFGKEQTEWIQ